MSSPPNLRLAELIGALSLAIDLGLGAPLEETIRTCRLAVRLGDAVGLSEPDLREVYYLALLRFVGCTSDAHTNAQLYGDELAAADWLAQIDFGQPTQLLRAYFRHVGADEPLIRRLGTLTATLVQAPRAAIENLNAHCEVAQRLAERFGLPPAFNAKLGQTFERWDGKGMPQHLRGDAIPQPVRIVQLAHQAELFRRIGGVDAAVAVVKERAGGELDPTLAAYFTQHAATLLADLDTESSWEAVLAAEPGPHATISADQFDVAAHAIADFTDLKSPFTIAHSTGVADLAVAAAEQCKLPASDIVTIRRAALVHDIGRVGVSASIWGKPGPLTASDWERVRLHPYYTERVLASAPALARLGALASLHHERLDGSGYPKGLPATMLTPSARLLAAADVYRALIELRPHRPAHTPEAAADLLRGLVRGGRLDSDAVNAVLAAAGHQVRPKRPERVGGLSDRELDVLQLLARGLSNREISARLFISTKTAGHHIQHIYNKLGVSTRAAATLFAMQHHLIDPDLPH